MTRRTTLPHTADGLKDRLRQLERHAMDERRRGDAPPSYVEESTATSVTFDTGTDTIVSGSSTEVVSHTLGVIPETVLLTPRGGELVWVSARTSTTFTASRAGTTGDLQFDYLLAGEEIVVVPTVPATDLELWLNAGDISGLADGDTVALWPDSSGHGRDLSSSGARMPTYKTGIVNGHPVVRFDGTRFMTHPHFASAFTAAEVFIVVKIDADPPAASGNTGIWGGLTTDGANPASHYPWTDGVIYEGFGTSTRRTVGNPTPSLAAWRLYNVRSAAGAWSAHLDGATLFSTGSNTVGFPAVDLVLGANTSAHYGLAGDVAEMALYSAVLSTDDRADIHSYFADKYGLTIA